MRRCRQAGEMEEGSVDEEEEEEEEDHTIAVRDEAMCFK